MTGATRSQSWRKRKEDAGLVRAEFWIPADKLQEVKDAIEKITGEKE